MITPHLDKIFLFRMVTVLGISNPSRFDKAYCNLIDKKQNPSTDPSAVKLVKTEPLNRKRVACYSGKAGNN